MMIGDLGVTYSQKSVRKIHFQKKQMKLPKEQVFLFLYCIERALCSRKKCGYFLHRRTHPSTLYNGNMRSNSSATRDHDPVTGEGIPQMLQKQVVLIRT